MLAVLFFFYFIAYIDRYSLTVMVEPIKGDLQLTDFQMSIILGPAFSLFYAAFGVPLGFAADRYSRRWVIFGGMFLWSCATVASGLANSFTSLLVARIFIAIGEASIVPAAYSLLADGFEKRRLTTAMAIFAAAQKAGLAAAFTLAAVAMASAAIVHGFHPSLADVAPWQAAFILLGAPGLVLAFLAFSFRDPPRRGGARKSKSLSDRQLFAYLKQRRDIMGPLAIAVALLSIVTAALSSWAPTFVSRQYGWPPLQYGPVLSVISLLAVGAVVAKGSIMDFLFARGMKDAHIRFYSWLLMFGVPLSVFAYSLPQPWLFFIALGALQAVVIPFMVYFLATIQLVAPSNLRGQLTGLYFGLAALVGNGVGPMAVGALNDFVFRDPDKLGWSLTIVSTFCLGISLLILRLLLRRLRPAIEQREAEEREQDAPAPAAAH